jgi:hypothetical protein
VLASLELVLKGTKLKVMWSRGAGEQKRNLDLLNPANFAPVPGLPAPLSASASLPPGFMPPSIPPPHGAHMAPGAAVAAMAPPPGMPPGFRAPGGMLPPPPGMGSLGLPPGIRPLDPTKAFLAPPPPRLPAAAPASASASAPSSAAAAGDALRVHYPSMNPARSGARGESS